MNENKLILGINWGAGVEMGWFGAKEYKNVDLNINTLILNEKKDILNILNWEQRESDYLILSKDDTSGDKKVNDYKDNEHITIDLTRKPYDHTLIFFVDNYTEQKFGEISHFDYRLYLGEPNAIAKKIYYKNITEIKDYENYESIILGYIPSRYHNFIPLNILFKSSNKITQDILKILNNNIFNKNKTTNQP
jgi:stress response protein SCP2